MYKTEEVAQLLGICYKTIWRWIQEGRVKSVRMGKNYKITQEELDYLLANGPREKGALDTKG